MQPIWFNSRTEGYEWLSNFHMRELTDPMNGDKYPSAEHLYQACKCRDGDPEARHRIQKAHTAAEAKKLGRTVVKRHNWEELKDTFMETTLHLKFTSPETIDLLDKLIETHPRELIHLSPWDLYWGMNLYKRGENKMGKILMKLRDEAIEWDKKGRPKPFYFYFDAVDWVNKILEGNYVKTE